MNAAPDDRSDRRPAPPEARPHVLSVVVPVFNEIATVKIALDALLAKEIEGWRLEIILVESNSSDGSREIVCRYRDHPRVKIVLQERPRGKGFAVREGFTHATGDVILIQDADLEYSLDDYERLITPIIKGEHAFVLGSRHGAGGGFAMRTFNDQPVHAFVLNCAHWTFATMINVSFGVWLKDPFTMYKVFRRDCLNGLTFQSNRFDFDWELLIKLIRKGYHPIEIPVSYRSRSFKEGKKISVIRDPITWMWALVKYRFQRL